MVMLTRLGNVILDLVDKFAKLPDPIRHAIRRWVALKVAVVGLESIRGFVGVSQTGEKRRHPCAARRDRDKRRRRRRGAGGAALPAGSIRHQLPLQQRRSRQ